MGGLYGAGTHGFEILRFNESVVKHGFLSWGILVVALLSNLVCKPQDSATQARAGMGCLSMVVPKLEASEYTEKEDDNGGGGLIPETRMATSLEELASDLSNIGFEKKLLEFLETRSLLKLEALSDTCAKPFWCCCCLLKWPASPKWSPHISYTFGSSLSPLVIVNLFMLLFSEGAISLCNPRECLAMLAPGARHDGAIVDMGSRFKLLEAGSTIRVCLIPGH
jgi:hypothetical protein